MMEATSGVNLRLYVVMPVYNEQDYLRLCLDSVTNQTLLPDKLLIVDDNSTDSTPQILHDYQEKYSWIQVVRTTAEQIHKPGSKVINAFNFGLSHLDQNFDVIVKLDSDLILPKDYFLTLQEHFNRNPKVAMVGGQAYLQKDRGLVLESLTDNDHIRGAFKAYRKAAFQQMGGLKASMGWDTVDELLCKYYHWEVMVDASLKVIHLKPTGDKYNKKHNQLQGEAFYKLGYGIIITAIASVKLALRKGKPMLVMDYLKGYIKAFWNQLPKLVTSEQEQFIRSYRWERMRSKLFK